jgi:succinate dehydrogenase/fumarate reductase flavoprotein subunit
MFLGIKFLLALLLAMAHASTNYDVVVVGGGASGTYAAVRLKDEGMKVLLIERDDHLVRIGDVHCQNGSDNRRAVM